ncbi:glycoprotease family protein [Trichoderma novae-zelandiae]
MLNGGRAGFGQSSCREREPRSSGRRSGRRKPGPELNVLEHQRKTHLINSTELTPPRLPYESHGFFSSILSRNCEGRKSQGKERQRPMLPPQCLSKTRRLASSHGISSLLTRTTRPARTTTTAAKHHHHHHHHNHLRRLVTLAIETSCDDTAVAILSKPTAGSGKTRLLFNERIASDNRAFKGINPAVTVVGHNATLAPLVEKALATLRCYEEEEEVDVNDKAKMEMGTGMGRRRTGMRVPDFVCATRGPGIMTNLSVGLNVAKGLAVAWGVPFVGVHHMQAHALTPRLVDALESSSPSPSSSSSPQASSSTPSPSPSFPFLSLLVSGGHTQLILSTSLTSHAILASTADIAIGNLLDQTARVILPPALLASSPDVMYGRLLEAFAFPAATGTGTGASAAAAAADYEAFFRPARSRADEIRDVESGFGWAVPVPFKGSRKLVYSFSSIYTHVHNIVAAANARANNNVNNDISNGVDDLDDRIPLEERRALARHTLRAAFQHLASRLVLALQDSPSLRPPSSPSPSSESPSFPSPESPSSAASESPSSSSAAAAAAASSSPIKTLVVAGGVASNRFLMHVLRTTLAARGFPDMRIVAPPVELCTDNAAMVAWAGMEMYEAGWRSELSVRSIAKWPLDPDVGGGILGAGGWVNVNVTEDGEE